MSKINEGRRQFMRQAGQYGLVCLAGTGALAVVCGCNGDQEAEKLEAETTPGHYKSAIEAAQEAADPCSNTAQLNAAALATRETFEYEARSADGTDLCKSCDFWRPAPTGELCGTCTIVKGPIHPLGTCITWEEKSDS